MHNFMEQRLSDMRIPCDLINAVDIPIELYKSIQGEYFVGYTDELTFGEGTSAWGWLFNSPDSGVNLHVNVWTISNTSEFAIRAQIWFNATPPGNEVTSIPATTTNFTLSPLPWAKVQVLTASNVFGDPKDGIKAFARRAPSETTLVNTENGKFIFPPGGSFLIFLSNPETPYNKAEGRIAFGWWEEKIYPQCSYPCR